MRVVTVWESDGLVTLLRDAEGDLSLLRKKSGYRKLYNCFIQLFHTTFSSAESGVEVQYPTKSLILMESCLRQLGGVSCGEV